MIKKFMNDVCWGELDFLLIDTPPGMNEVLSNTAWKSNLLNTIKLGTSDEHMAVMENIREMNFGDFSAVLVTTPQVKIIFSNFKAIKTV